MRSLLVETDDFLRGCGRFALTAKVSTRFKWLLGFVIVFGAFYGMIMATYTGLAPGRFHQLLYIAVKVPMLLLVSFFLCLPSFFVMNTILGLREDFRQALSAVIATQSCLAIVLACLAPVTVLFYLSTTNYPAALNFNGAVFAVASLTAQVVTRRYYSPLIRKSGRHRLMMYLWFVIYIFVAMQMAWCLRPFLCSPNMPVTFFRDEKWGNAYVEIFRNIVAMFD